MSCRKLIASSVALALCSVAADGRAQLRGDLGAYGGVSQRVLAGASGGGALPGPILGAIVVTALPEWLRFIGAARDGVFGIVLILIVAATMPAWRARLAALSGRL